jgi:hypothetical protein
MPRLVRALALALAVLPGLSCGLISEDVTDFNLKLPEKPFNVDTADWMLTAQGTVPSLACPPADCGAVADQFCAPGACTSDCDPNAHCQAHVKVSVSQPFDLANESPELETIDSQTGIEVTVESVTFKVNENTLNVASPPLEVYLAPQGVLDATSPEAVFIGTVESVPAKQTGDVPIDFTETGRAAMEQFMSDYKTPFTVIVAGDVTMHAGDPVPEGKLSGIVSVQAHAGI